MIGLRNTNNVDEKSAQTNTIKEETGEDRPNRSEERRVGKEC